MDEAKPPTFGKLRLIEPAGSLPYGDRSCGSAGIVMLAELEVTGVDRAKEVVEVVVDPSDTFADVKRANIVWKIPAREPVT